MSPPSDKLVLNSYIERLIDSRGHDAEARGVVAEFGRTLIRGSRFGLKARLPRSGDSVRGFTAEHGTVQIEDSRNESKEITIGDRTERVGYYKVCRAPHKSWISISHFWKADEGTESETELAQEWALAVDAKGLPVWFAERAMRTVWTLRLTSAFELNIEREIYPEMWGPHEGSEHLGGFHVGIVLTR